MNFIDIADASAAQHREAARILSDALAHDPTAWPTAEAAMPTVEKCLRRADRTAIVAVEGGAVLGWIGAVAYSACTWELHPLAVDPPRQRQGVGTALVGALERAAAARGVASLWLGADDAFGGTSLFDKDLYPDPLAPLARITAVGRHPFTFYRRVGFSVCGVIPDATGPGRHDILMSKRIGPNT